MIIRPTAKLAKKIKVNPQEVLPATSDPFVDWSARLFNVGRTQQVMLTNTASLYSVVMPGAGVTDLQSLMDRALEALAERLASDGLQDVYNVRILPAWRDASVSKALSQSVTGSMNDLEFTVNLVMYEEGLSRMEASQRINEMPMGSLKFASPGKAFAAMAGEHGLHIEPSAAAGKREPFTDMQAASTEKMPPKGGRRADGTKRACGLCGKKKNLRRTECCGNWICDDEHTYVIFSYSRNSCDRNHNRYTLCGFHHNEGHPGRWQDCEQCRKSFETEMYVYYGTNEYNFETLANPPAYEPTCCVQCGRTISLGEDGYTIADGEYYCMRCDSASRGRSIPVVVEDDSDTTPALLSGDGNPFGGQPDDQVEISLERLLAEVDEAYHERYVKIVQCMDHFCDEHLNNEYKQLSRIMATLVCAPGSPARKGKPESWAAGVVYALGKVNFLHDPSQSPHMKPDELARGIGVSPATMYAKAGMISRVLELTAFDPNWTLPSRMADNPLVWMIEVNGVLMDIRDAPREAQVVAYEQGLIPYIPADYEDLGSYDGEDPS